MEFCKKVMLKSGETCILRHAEAKDADGVLGHLLLCCQQSPYLGRYRDEVSITLEEEKEFLQKCRASSNELMLVAQIKDTIVATASFGPVQDFDKYRHRGVFGISVKKDYWHKGIGTVLLDAIIEAATLAGYEQLELEVVAGNEHAVELYCKKGFEVYGRLENAYRMRDGSYQAELRMVKLLKW